MCCYISPPSLTSHPLTFTFHTTHLVIVPVYSSPSCFYSYCLNTLIMGPRDLVDAWRQRVPSRLDRDDPFDNDGFEERPATRLVSPNPTQTTTPFHLLTLQTFRQPDPPTRRPSTRLSFLRAATPLFGRPSTSSSRPSTGLSQFGEGKSKRKSLLSLLTRKRKRRSPSPEPEPKEPVRLNFLFVGSSKSGQTSLLL